MTLQSLTSFLLGSIFSPISLLSKVDSHHPIGKILTCRMINKNTLSTFLPSPLQEPTVSGNLSIYKILSFLLSQSKRDLYKKKKVFYSTLKRTDQGARFPTRKINVHQKQSVCSQQQTC